MLIGFSTSGHCRNKLLNVADCLEKLNIKFKIVSGLIEAELTVFQELELKEQCPFIINLNPK